MPILPFGDHHPKVDSKAYVSEQATVVGNVEIGANTCIDRGTFDTTVIGKNTKIDNLVQIAHNVRIGEHCLIVAQAGIAGSTTIGKYCILGGQVGIVGHIKIGNNVTIAGQAGVINNVPDGMAVLGSPAVEATKAKRAYSLIEHLPDMRKKVRSIEKRLEKIETPNPTDQ